MISPPTSPQMSTSRSSTKSPCGDNENDNSASPPLSPKRSFAQDEEDRHQSQLDFKRRHVNSESQVSRRAPLDPLSASDLENRRSRDQGWATSSAHHSLVTSSSVPDLRAFRLGQAEGSWGQQCSATGSPTAESLCSWPPPMSTSSAGSSLHSSQSGPHGLRGDILYSSEAKKSSRASRSGTTLSWPPPETSQTDTAPMIKPTRTPGWKAENVLQPIKSRNNSTPFVRRPPGDLWQVNSSSSSSSSELRSGSEPVRTVHGLVAGDTLLYSTSPLTPPGLSPYRPELRRSGSDSNINARGSVSLSLASGSQPLRASEQAKSVVPIGAERSRVVSMTPIKPEARKSNPAPAQATDPSDPSLYLWYTPLLSPKLQAKWKGLASSQRAPDTPPEPTSHAKVSREDFDRLLRQATKNKHAAKIISPLSPLRTPTPAFTLTADPAYQLHMPSLSNKPSPRYSKKPERRLRTLCDSYQPHDLDSTCIHCQECKRDTIGKRLLAFRYRQKSHHNRLLQISYSNNKEFSLARSHREIMIEGNEEDEKSLWDEVAAVTSTEPFSRSGSSCAVTNLRIPASPRLQDLHDFNDDDEYPEIPDEALLTNESVAHLREVSVY
ncbi:hypothetical protein HYDPIDRAFT_186580 [Hydnomerulius pinastri MD-312]|nr:hypothetical protein HYDPIDRAFT_186580 [Hydnomerulius pinastri MD-312]